SALEAAAQDQFNTGSLKGYEKLSQNYFETLDQRSPDQIIAAGKHLNARYDSANKNVVVTIPGVGEMSWAAAVKAQYLMPHYGTGRRAVIANKAVAKQQAAQQARQQPAQAPVSNASGHPQLSASKAAEFSAYWTAPGRTQAERQAVWSRFSKHYGVA